MTTIEVSASKTYSVQIGTGLLSTLGQVAAGLGEVRHICIVSEDTVWPLYSQAALDSLSGFPWQVSSFVFPAGEASKNGLVYLDLLEHLAQTALTRQDLIVALGGGVVGDLAGFAAATYLRGIRLIQVPTTLLAAVDSSVGGKTAIDLGHGKNLAGAFFQPSAVLCDPDTLNTLPEEIFRDGCAEVIKYAILYDPELFDRLKKDALQFPREQVIARCIAHKRNVVCQDEYDTGMRQMLNLGHTIGHSVEALSNYTLSHGKAVAIGTAIVTRASQALGICDGDTAREIIDLLTRFGLPTTTEFSAQALFRQAQSDKKRAADGVNLIVPAAIGSCLLRPTRLSELESFIEAGL